MKKAFALVLLSSLPTMCLSATAEAWTMQEFVFEGSEAVERDGVEMDVVFTDGVGELARPAFWDGGATYKVRFAAPRAGKWSYVSRCADDSALDGKSGEFEAVPYSGDLEIFKRGFVKTEKGKKYFVYGDGTPFFYLGDTHWGMYTEEFENHFDTIVDRRVEQGFTVYQSEPVGEKFRLCDGHVDAEDLKWLREADRMFAYIAGKGLVHANAGLMHASEMTADLAFDDAALRRLARYWVARYGAWPVIWTIAQECDNDYYYERAGDQKIYSSTNNPWVKIAGFTHAADAYSHPLSVHQESFWWTTVTGRGKKDANASGGGASAFAAEEVREKTGHDFWAAQWSPSLSGAQDMEVVADYWESDRVAIDYEGRYCNLWTKDRGARYQGWISYLSGMYGYGYGAQDSWLYRCFYDMENPSDDGIDTVTVEDKKVGWRESLEFPSAIQMGHMKSFLESHEWWTLKPELGRKRFSCSGPCVCAWSDTRRVAYFYGIGDQPTGEFHGLRPYAGYEAEWFDPCSGETFALGDVASEDGSYKVPAKPGAGDWVFSLRERTENAVVVLLDNTMAPAEMTAKVRAAKAANPGRRIEARLAEGVYALEEPLVLGLGDSGENGSPVVWKASGRVVLCGGSALSGWRDDGDGVWSCPAPRDENGGLVWFNSLYANGRRADCARAPNRRPYAEEYLSPSEFRHVPPEGYVRGDSDDWGPGDEYFSFGAPLHEFDALAPEELNHVVVKGCDAWTFSSHELLGYDEQTGEFHIQVLGRIFSCYWTGWNRGLVWFENLRAGFDMPGEWFYDWCVGRILYRPLEGETIEGFEALAPSSQLVSVLELRGDPENGKFVHDVSFDGVVFSCSMADGHLTPQGIRRQFPLQSAVGCGGAVYMRGAERISLLRCKVEHTENYGFRLDEGTRHCVIIDCELTDLGAGGIFAGNTKTNQLQEPGEYNAAFRPGHSANIHPGYAITNLTDMSVAFITVDDCLVSGGGRFNPEGSGIFLTNVSDSKVTHNEIADMYYTGVSVGWTWGYYKSVAQRNTIAFNRIHDFGKHVMADMGGVYTLGTSFGTVVTNNVIYNVDSFSYGGWGLYNDEGSEGILWENNLVYDTSSSSYHLHYGRGNTVRNNILAFGGEARLIVSASNIEGGVDFERNIVIWSDAADGHENRTFRFDDIYGGGNPGATFKDNLFWNLAGETKLGDRAEGTIADPLFEDAAGRDFRLKEGSPAFGLGFVPFDASLAGRR
ncbi:MAG: DUF4038 domain-containing protein [Kiritimatiellae bacterium]|nr:DUF4038 domain-containing protein [Kiritimatiellia bacterium]